MIEWTQLVMACLVYLFYYLVYGRKTKMEKIIDKLEPIHLFILLLVVICFFGYTLVRGIVVKWGDKEFGTGIKNDKSSNS